MIWVSVDWKIIVVEGKVNKRIRNDKYKLNEIKKRKLIIA
jgi:hypothetical protein